MNIFYLDPNPKLAAQYHVDKHVVKMILESCQLLCTAHRVLDGNDHPILYKETHTNHPSAIWVRKSIQNYDWLCELTDELCQEYSYRYDKIHLCESKGLVQYLQTNKPLNIGSHGFCEPTQAMPDDSKVLGDSVAAYCKYYATHKTHIHSWKHRESPYWL